MVKEHVGHDGTIMLLGDVMLDMYRALYILFIYRLGLNNITRYRQAKLQYPLRITYKTCMRHHLNYSMLKLENIDVGCSSV